MKKILSLLLFAVCTITLPGQVPDLPLLKVFDKAYRIAPQQNFLLSPWGIQQCFGMIAGGAGQISAEELSQTLGLDQHNMMELQQAHQSLSNCSKELNNFNAVFFDQQYTLQQQFINNSVRHCNGRFYGVDFRHKDKCLMQINDIVKRESRGQFEQLFTPETLANKPAMVIMNVFYFKDHWQNCFKKYNTRPELFTIPDYTSKNSQPDHVQIKMMNDSRFVPYCNDGTIHGITLSYQNRRFKLLLLTAVDLHTPLSVVTAALARHGLDYFLNKSSSKNKTVIKIPQLNLSGNLDLNELLTPLGMKTIFDPQLGDLTGIAEGKTLYIDKARQLLKLKLDENGTEAAAVTYALPKAASAPPRKEKFNFFYADHPFVLVLFDTTTRAIILAGIVVDPR